MKNYLVGIMFGLWIGLLIGAVVADYKYDKVDKVLNKESLNYTQGYADGWNDYIKQFPEYTEPLTSENEILNQISNILSQADKLELSIKSEPNTGKANLYLNIEFDNEVVKE